MLRSWISRLLRARPRHQLCHHDDFAAVFATSQCALLMLQDEQVLQANNAFAELLGLSIDRMLGAGIHDILPPDIKPADLGLDIHEVVEGEASLHSFDGLGHRDVRLRICRIGGEDSRPLLLLSADDMTDRQFSERVLRDHARRLRILSRQVMEVQEQERRNLARELHDEIGQQLTMVRLGLERMATAPASAASGIVRELVDQVAALTEQVRSLSLDLRPSMLDDLGLAATLRWYAGRSAKLAGLELQLAIHDEFPRLPADTETGMFRIAQEAMNNIIKHARAHRLELSLGLCDGEVLLEVRDDGRGFDEAAARYRADRGESAGLLGMQERAALLDAVLEIESSPGSGCRVRLSLPMHWELDRRAKAQNSGET